MFLPIHHVLFLVLISVSVCFSQAQNKLGELKGFEGKWKGKAIAYYPRDSTKTNRLETVLVPLFPGLGFQLC